MLDIIVIIVVVLVAYFYFTSSKIFRDHSITPLNSISEEELEKYPDITKLSRNISRGTLSRSNRRTEDVRIIHSIVLLSSNHRKKIYIESFEESETAIERLKTLSKELNKNIVKYNPKVSENTKARRR